MLLFTQTFKHTEMRAYVVYELYWRESMETYIEV